MYGNDNDLESELAKFANLVANRPAPDPDFEDPVIRKQMDAISSQMDTQRLIKKINLEYLVNNSVGLKDAASERVVVAIDQVYFQDDESTDWCPDYNSIIDRVTHFESNFADSLSSGRLDGYNPEFRLSTEKNVLTVIYEDIGYELKLADGASNNLDIKKIMDAENLQKQLGEQIQSLSDAEYKKKTIINGLVGLLTEEEKAFVVKNETLISDIYQSLNARTPLRNAMADEQALSLFMGSNTESDIVAGTKMTLMLKEHLATEEKRDDLFERIKEHRRNHIQMNRVDFDEIEREFQADLDALRAVANASEGDVIDLATAKRAKEANGFAVSYFRLEQMELDDEPSEPPAPIPSNVTPIFKPKP